MSKSAAGLWRSLLTGEAAIKSSYSIKDRLWGMLVTIKPRFAIMITPVNAASAAVLSYGGYPSLSKCLLGFSAVACASAATIVLNDIVDRYRDIQCWPNRGIPSHRVKLVPALGLSLALFATSLFLAWFYFNPQTFLILASVLVLGVVYATFLRRKVGYLSLPPIVGMIYLGGWAAFSPDTLFTSRLPWLLYFLGALWQGAHIMVYSPLHPLHREGEKLLTESKAFFFSTSPWLAVLLGLVFLILTTGIALLLPLFTRLGLIYLIIVSFAAGWALARTLKFLKEPTSRECGFPAFSAVSTLRTAISGAILLDVLVYNLMGS